MDVNTLKTLHEQTVRLSDKRFKLVCKFFSGLSDFNDLKTYFKTKTKINSDKNRAEFLCILIKEKFLEKQGVPASFVIRVITKEIWVAKKDSPWDTTLEFDTHEKTVHFSCSWANWDSMKIQYKFDCLSLFSGILFEEKEEGTKKQGRVDYFKYIDSFRPEDHAIENGNDQYMRILIDSLFYGLKKKILKEVKK